MYVVGLRLRSDASVAPVRLSCGQDTGALVTALPWLDGRLPGQRIFRQLARSAPSLLKALDPLVTGRGLHAEAIACECNTAASSISAEG
jgi:hypothetical protein